MSDELPGYSVFYKDEAGEIFHTYSTFARGTELIGGVYGFLDVTPQGPQRAARRKSDRLGPATTTNTRKSPEIPAATARPGWV